MEFSKFKKAIQEHFAKLSETADHVYEVEVDKDALWNLYLDSFPAGTNEIYRQRREYDCSSCRKTTFRPENRSGYGGFGV